VAKLPSEVHPIDSKKSHHPEKIIVIQPEEDDEDCD
jgi:hypothetical protein